MCENKKKKKAKKILYFCYCVFPFPSIELRCVNAPGESECKPGARGGDEKAKWSIPGEMAIREFSEQSFSC